MGRVVGRGRALSAKVDAKRGPHGLSFCRPLASPAPDRGADATFQPGAGGARPFEPVEQQEMWERACAAQQNAA